MTTAGVAEPIAPPSTDTKLPRVIVVQDAARLHYAVPLALQRAGMLERMYTDFFIRPGSLLAAASPLLRRLMPLRGGKMAGRRCDEIDNRRIRANNLHGLRWFQRKPARDIPASFWIWASERIGDMLLRDGFGDANAIFGFVNAIDPRVLAEARARGLFTVADQMIAPISVELAAIQTELKRWPGWERATSLGELRKFEEYQRRTWSNLDHMTCASDFVRDGLIADGVSPNRITTIPYPIDSTHLPYVNRDGRKGPMTVGFVGAVGLRKGAPYYFEVARRMSSRDVRFVMVGNVTLDRDMASRHGGSVVLTGQVPRQKIREYLESFDIFYFPSTCEGSAGAVIEAMASGLPIVASTSSGTFARDGTEGFIHRYDDVDGSIAAIERLLDDAPLRARMGAAARARVDSLDIHHYQRAITALFRDLMIAS